MKNCIMAEKEKKAIETSLHNEQMETERLRQEMQEKADQHASILSDRKDRMIF